MRNRRGPPLARHPSGSVIAVMLFLGTSWIAQAQTPKARVIASPGLYPPPIGNDEAIWETSIAAPSLNEPGGSIQNDRIVAVHQVGPRGLNKGVGFAHAKQTGGTWNWTAGGIIGVPSGFGTAFDPTIGYNRRTGNFILAAGLDGAVGERIGVAHYFPAQYDPNSFTPFSDGFVQIPPSVYGNPPGNTDKPTLAVAEMTSTIQEAYVVMWIQGGSYYVRSTNGGYSWLGGPILGCYGFVTPCTTVDGRVYVAEYGSGSPAVKFFQGTDITNPSDPNFGKVDWTPVETSQVDPDLLVMPMYTAVVTRYLPLPTSHAAVYNFPRMAADPLDANILYVAYHDLKNAASGQADEDVNIYLRRLIRNPSTGYWSISGRVQVNDDDDPNALTPSDDFLPEIVVTHQPGQPAHVHVIYYSDRRWDTQVDNNPEYPKFDVFYARSEDAGLTFPSSLHFRMFKYSSTDPGDPPVIDYLKLPRDATPGNKPFELNDYIGLRLRSTGTETQLWSAYTSSDDNAPDQTYHATAISASEIK